VVIDPGHGGDDRGALLADNLAEKDVALAWARRLRAALERQGIAVALLRESDAALSVEQRAANANTARPAAFISVHAGAGARGVHLYTAHLPDTTQKPGSFLPWDTAQASYLDLSRALAGSVAAELSKHEVQVSTAPVLMRPLSNVAAAAIALEVTAPHGEVLALLAPEYQQSICAAVADGIAAVAASRAASARPAPAHQPEAAQ
jgi:N-acetylmuramoyl-L-alanine amidase